MVDDFTPILKGRSRSGYLLINGKLTYWPRRPFIYSSVGVLQPFSVDGKPRWFPWDDTLEQAIIRNTKLSIRHDHRL